MKQKPEIVWNSELEKELFANAGLVEFADFWNMDKACAPAGYKPIRQHVDRRTGRIKRQMVCFKVNGFKYYLKCASGKFYQCIVNEFEALKVLPEFGLIPAKLLSFSFNEKEKKAFLLFKNLGGFYSLKDILEFKAPPDVIADFQARQEDFFKKLVTAVRNIQSANYFYPDWHRKHIFVKRHGDEIALIDVERFLPLKKCPWYYKFLIPVYFIRRKEWKTLGMALGSKRFTRKFLKGLLRE